MPSARGTPEVKFWQGQLARGLSLSSNVDDLKTLTALLDMTNEAWELASEIEKPERLKQLVTELRSRAKEERKGLKQERIGTRYDLCMIGILEELSFGRVVSWQNVVGLDSRLPRIREEIERTILEIKANRRVM